MASLLPAGKLSAACFVSRRSRTRDFEAEEFFRVGRDERFRFHRLDDAVVAEDVLGDAGRAPALKPAAQTARSVMSVAPFARV